MKLLMEFPFLLLNILPDWLERHKLCFKQLYLSVSCILHDSKDWCMLSLFIPVRTGCMCSKMMMMLCWAENRVRAVSMLTVNCMITRFCSCHLTHTSRWLGRKTPTLSILKYGNNVWKCLPFVCIPSTIG